MKIIKEILKIAILAAVVVFVVNVLWSCVDGKKNDGFGVPSGNGKVVENNKVDDSSYDHAYNIKSVGDLSGLNLSLNLYYKDGILKNYTIDSSEFNLTLYFVEYKNNLSKSYVKFYGANIVNINIELNTSLESFNFYYLGKDGSVLNCNSGFAVSKLNLNNA